MEIVLEVRILKLSEDRECVMDSLLLHYGPELSDRLVVLLRVEVECKCLRMCLRFLLTHAIVRRKHALCITHAVMQDALMCDILARTLALK